MSIKRTLALILALAMIFSLGVPTYAFAEEGETEESVEALAPVEVIDEIEEAEAISLEPVAETQDLASSVAEVYDSTNGGYVYFDTLEDAIAAAGVDGLASTITLRKDNLAVSYGADKTVTIASNGHPIASVAVSAGELTLSGATVSGDIAITGGKLTSSDLTGKKATLAGGELALSGTSKLTDTIAIDASAGTLSISGGNYEVAQVSGSGVVGNVTGGTFLKIDTALLANGVVPADYTAGTPIGDSVNGTVTDGGFQAMIGTGAGRIYFAKMGEAVEAAATAEDDTIVNLKTLANFVLPRPSGIAAIRIAKGSADITVKPADDTYAILATDEGDTTLYEAKTAVAKIGSTNYASVKSALEVVADGQTVVLLGDATLSENATVTAANVTLGLNDKTLTVAKGAEIKVADNASLTVTNGTVKKTGDAENKKIGVLSAGKSATLTVDDAIVEADGVALRGTDSKYSKIVLVDATVTGGLYAIRSAGTVIVEEGASTVDGDITGATISIAGAANKFTKEIALEWCAEGWAPAPKGADGYYHVTAISGDVVATATVGGVTTYYASLEDAVIAAYEGGTVSILKDVVSDPWDQNTSAHGYNVGPRNLVIEGNGHVWEVKSLAGNAIGNGDDIFHQAENLQISDLTIKQTGTAAMRGLDMKSGSLTNVTIVGGDFGVNVGGPIVVDGCTFDGQGWCGLYWENEASAQEAVIKNSTFKNCKATDVMGGMTFQNNTIESTASVNLGYNFANSKLINEAGFTGNTIEGTLTIWQNTTKVKGNDLSKATIEVETAAASGDVESVDLSDNYFGEKAPDGLDSRIVIDSFYTDKDLKNKANTHFAVLREDNTTDYFDTFTAAADAAKATTTPAKALEVVLLKEDVADPYALAEGQTLKVKLNGKGLEVTLNGAPIIGVTAEGITTYSKDTATVAEAKIGDKLYETLAAALADAKAKDTIVLLTDATLPTDTTYPGFSLTIDINKNTLTLLGDHHLSANADLIIKNGNVVAKDSVGDGTFNSGIDLTREYALTLEDVVVSTSNSVGFVCFDSKNSALTIKNSTLNLDSCNYYVFYTQGTHVTIEDSEINVTNSMGADRAFGYAFCYEAVYDIKDSEINLVNEHTAGFQNFVGTLDNTKIVINTAKDGIVCDDVGHFQAELNTLTLKNGSEITITNASGKAFNVSSDYYVVKDASSTISPMDDFFANVGDAYYTTFAAAATTANAAETGDPVVELLAKPAANDTFTLTEGTLKVKLNDKVEDVNSIVKVNALKVLKVEKDEDITICSLNEKDGVAHIDFETGTLYYATFAEAVAAAAGKEIIVLDANAEYTLSYGETLNVKNNGKAITLDKPEGYEINKVSNPAGGWTYTLLKLSTISFYADEARTELLGEIKNVVEGTKMNTLATQIPEVPAKEGYRYSGWQKTTGEHWSFNNVNEMPAEDLDLILEYTIEKYTITFKSERGNFKTAEGEALANPYVVTAEYATDLVAPVATCNGFTFQGWYVEGDAAQKIVTVPSTIPAANTTYVAKWEINVVTITFDMNGATSEQIAPITQNFGTKVTAPADPTRTGYEFKGWSPAIPSTMPSADLTVVAQWAEAEASLIDGLGNVLYFADFEDAKAEFNKGGNANIYKGITIEMADLEVKIADGEKLFIILNGHDEDFHVVPALGDEADYFVAPPESKPDSVSGKTITVYSTEKCIAAVEYTDYKNVTQPDFSVVETPIETPRVVYYPTFKAAANAALDPEVPGDYDGTHPVVVMLQDNTEPYPLPHDKTLAVKTDGHSTKLEAEPGYKLYVSGPVDGVHTFYCTEQVTVTFDYGVEGIDAPAAQTFDIGGKATEPTALTRKGYDFAGWFNGDAEEAFDFETSVEESITLTAHWTPINYFVVFIKGADDVTGTMENQTLTYDKAENLTPNAYERVGYTFTGWKHNAADAKTFEDGEEVLNLTSVAGGYGLTAQWTANQHKLTLDANGGTWPEGATTEYMRNFGTPISNILPAAADRPTRVGYSFGGWLYGDKIVSDATILMPDEDVTLVAKWDIITYNISYNLQGAKLPEGQTNPTTYTVESEDITLINPTAEGFEFTGWTGTGLEEPTLTVVIPHGSTGDREYDTTWSYNEYTVTYDANGGLVVNPYPVLDEEGNPVLDEEGNKTFESVEVLEITDKYRTAIEKPAAPTRVGYAFQGWAEAEEVEGKLVAKTKIDDKTGEEVPALVDKLPEAIPLNGMKLIAVWEANTYKVAFKQAQANGNDLWVEVVYDTEITAPTPDPTQEGYTFGGWFMDTARTKQLELPAKATSEILNVNPAEGQPSLILYPKWNPETYKITYEGLEGATFAEGEKNPDTYTPDDEPFTLFNPTKVGYDFKGWMIPDDTAYDHCVVQTSAKKDLTYIATWEPTVYTITFNYAYGWASNVKSFTIETETFTLNNPTKEGYEFAGWTGTGIEGVADSITIEKGSTGNRSYTATWNIKSYTVTFDTNGGSDVEAQTVQFKQHAEMPAENPTKVGYNFVEWYILVDKTDTDGNVVKDEEGNAIQEKKSFDFEHTEITADITIYADWKVHSFMNTFNTGDGAFADGTTSINVYATYGGKVNTPADPKRDGYEFAGWDPEVPETQPDNKLTFTAKWDIKTYTISYEGVDDTTGMPTEYTVENLPVTIPNPTREGYTFNGWTLKIGSATTDLPVSATGATISAGNILADRTYIAKWQGNPVNLMFMNGSSIIKSCDVKNGTGAIYGESMVTYAPTLNDVNKVVVYPDGKTLDGTDLWVTEKGEKIPAVVSGEAVYQLNWKTLFTVSFEYNGLTLKTLDKVMEGTTVAASEAPEIKQDGKAPTQWIDADTGAQFVFGETEVTRNITLNPSWEPVEEPTPEEPDYSDLFEVHYALQLQDSIIINYYVVINDKTANPSDFAVSIDDGAKVRLSDPTVNQFVIGNFNATEMNNTVNVKVFYKGEQVAEGDYSIRSYCEFQIEQFKDKENSETLMNLLHAVLDYGARAQEFFGSADEAANATYGYMAPVQEIPAGEVTKTNNGIAGITNVNYALELQGKLAMNLYFAHDDGVQVSDYTFTLNGKELPVNRIQDLTLGGNKYFYVSVTDIALLDLAKTQEVVVTDANGGTYTFSGSPVNYLYTQKSGNASDLASALYTYYYFANEYFVVK